MIRLFETHRIRPYQELTGLWTIIPAEGELAGNELLTMVPGCWEQVPGLENYRGQALYRKTIACGGNVRLVFKGVSHTADVLWDGEPVAHHYNAYTSFDTVLRNVQEGEHTLEILVDNRFGPESALHIPNDYHTYGGIIRPVVLETLRNTYIEWVHAIPEKHNGEWMLSLKALVKNLQEEPVDVEMISRIAGQEIIWPKTRVASEAVLETRAVVANAEEYLPESPKLYLLHTELSEKDQIVDDLTERVGFREISISGKEILWNGRPIRIKGFCRHEDHALFGSALPLEAMVQDLITIRDLHGNAVRTSHYPNDERFLDLCDEMGIMVWEENHARGLDEEHMRNPHFRKQCLDCIDEMIRQDQNHPSIMIWGILNECASDTEYGRMCYQEQFARIRELDPSRPVSFASCRFNNDICLDLVDIVSYNMYPLWYSTKQPKEYAKELVEYAGTAGGLGKPFIISEVGAGGIYGYRNDACLKWSEERQAQILCTQIQEVLNMEEICGMFIWQFCDVRVSEEWSMNRPRTMNNKGIVDEYRRKKLAYKEVQREYGRFSSYR